jgi:trans-2,3-dihydro-3-hydroxyanthranilate isomerase
MHPYVVLDVFTDVPLQGNQLAVFTDGSGLSAELMQRTARELNLSETVFLLAPEDGADAHARARVFTPAAELPFAGHPVLGSAFVVGEQQDSSFVRLQTGAGVIPVALKREAGAIVYGEMQQPIPEVEPFERTAELLEALGLEGSSLPIEAYRNGPVFVYVGLQSEDEVAAMSPNLGALERLGVFGVHCFAGQEARFRSRVFAPALGVPEDPATGSAAGPLALHLARHGRIRFGAQIEILQGVEIGRPSTIYAQVDGSHSEERIERVLVGGSAVTVARGEYLLGD